MPKKLLRLLLIGSPGSGKGTQSKFLRQDYGLRHISSGDILRNCANNDPTMKRLLSNGGFVDSKLVLGLVQREISTCLTKNILLDGFPRTVEQAKDLDQMLGSNNQELDLVVYLNVPQQTIIDRLAGRLVHEQSGRTYNLNFDPPKVPFKDDLTGEQLTKRPDDRPENIRRRLEQFTRDIEPLLDFYDNQSKLFSVSGDSSSALYPKIQEKVDSILLGHDDISRESRHVKAN